MHGVSDFRYLSEDMAGEETAEEMGGMDETSESDSFQVSFLCACSNIGVIVIIVCFPL